MYDCLFLDDLFLRKYVVNFLSKVFWYFGVWIFYFVLIKGELVLFDKSMYDLDKNKEKLDRIDGEEKIGNKNIEKYFYYINDIKSGLEVRGSEILKERKVKVMK